MTTQKEAPARGKTVTFEIPGELAEGLARGRDPEALARLALECLLARGVWEGRIGAKAVGRALGLSEEESERFFDERGFIPDLDPEEITDAERAASEAAVLEGIADFEAGRFDTAENVFARLRAKHGA